MMSTLQVLLHPLRHFLHRTDKSTEIRAAPVTVGIGTAKPDGVQRLPMLFAEVVRS